MGRLLLKIFAIALLGTLLLKCNILPEKVPVEGEVTFSLIEDYKRDTGKPKLKLFLETENYYSPGDYLVAYSKVRGNEIEIEIKHVNKVDIGIELAVLVSVSWEDYVSLGNDRYEVIIIYEEKIDSYLVNVTDSSITINPRVQIFTNGGYETYWRYPDNSFHCYSYGYNLSEISLFNGVVDSLLLLTEIDTYEFLEDGVNAFEWVDGQRDSLSVFFTYTNKENFQQACEVFENYSTNVIPDSVKMTIRLRNWRNEHYSSDDFRN